MFQPCARCKGPTEKREMMPGYFSNYCPKCGVFTADSDGEEQRRLQRWVDIAWPIALRVARRELSASEAVNQ